MADHRYRVIKRLEAGGMAEVYLGEAQGLQDFKKRVAIKRVLPHLAKNESFIQMFLDEARLSAKLSHANIVTVFDISARDDTYFLIMEFVDGANLKRILESLQRRGRTFPLSEAIYVCAEACSGLQYAHELADENGKKLGIVHRDISPPNIMITNSGEVKVADFGLAKAGTQLSQTDPGVVKGKFSYLSPEAASGLEVDARADIFSLGIVLWEMLSGRRLFLGETDYATVKLIQQANIPRLGPLNTQVDEAFEEIMLRALARDRRARYQSAQEFGAALTGYLFARQLRVGRYDIAALVNSAIVDDVTPAKTDTFLISRMIQDELDQSIAVQAEHMPLPVGTQALEPENEGAFEDPASWFIDEPEPASGNGPRTPRPANTPPKTGWHESGVEYQPELIEDNEDTEPTGDGDDVLHTPAGSVDDRHAGAQQAPNVPPGLKVDGGLERRPSSSGVAKYIVMGMAALLAVLAIAIALLGKRL